ncbi:MAG: LexA family transcriptional regulator [Bdellovibrionales bacterium]|jgi:DNA-binding transcriptional regulator YdaS (Cro superfamily)|nr:LexA family transcriptional regulator [Bdellovibrionales bacterium]
MTRLHDKIRQILESSPRLTQRGLAERMGLDPAAVNRMLYGRRSIMAEEIPVIEDYLGEKLDLTETAPIVLRRRGLSDIPQADVAPPAQNQNFTMQPVSAQAAHPVLPDSMTPVPVYSTQGDETPIDWTARHPAQAGMRSAFALYVPDNRMTPRYFAGEIVYVHPHRPPAAPQDVVIAHSTGHLQIARMVQADADSIEVEYMNPPQRETYQRSALSNVYAIVGRG